MAPTIQKRKYLLNNIKSTILNSDNIELNDVICPVCCSIFVEPVVLPCNHGFCLSCFNNLIKNNPLTCINCRTRFGSWLRNATKNKQLVNHKLWNIIQKKFSHYFDRKQELKQDEIEENFFDNNDGDRNNINTSNIITNTNVKKDSFSSLSPATTTEETKNYQKLYLTPIINQLSNDRKIEENYVKKFETTTETTKIITERLYNNSSTLAKEKFPANNNNNNNNNISDEYFEIEDDETPISSMSVSTTDSNNKINLIIPEETTTTTPPPTTTTISSNKEKLKFIKNNNENKMSSNCQYLINNNDIYTNNTFTNKINLLKTFAIQINRGTEYLKQTVHNALVTSKVTPDKLMQLKPNDLHKNPNPNRCSNSRDSLNEEMYHFKPIKSYATTPKRIQCSSSVLKVPTIRKVNNDNSFNSLAHGTCNNIKLNEKPSAFCAIDNTKTSCSKNVLTEDDDDDDEEQEQQLQPPPPPTQIINKINSTNLKRKCTNRNLLDKTDINELKIKKVKIVRGKGGRRGRKRKEKLINNKEEMLPLVVNSNNNNKTVITRKTRSKCDNKFLDNNNSNNDINKKKNINTDDDDDENEDDDDDILIIKTKKKSKELQEKNDYEFAKKLQYELNKTTNNNNNDDNNYLLTSKTNCNKTKRKCTLIKKNYSLRNRKSINNDNNDNDNCRKGNNNNNNNNNNIININTRSNRRTIT